ncbi:putative transposon Ty3-I Gag-Pol polyprotein [Operophtera brumata]|uniref:Putative transposon Ty3-I Gag-Pol polyprotein n=1 Tax=Operophtera brumata TaxID=104452 RepID=A0A0L7L9B8_OPEBR|nr:putative transposon Ty3-I Gag-Pol polyprotein [Operophtera brumata]
MVQSDNRLVVAYITKQGGTKSLHLLLTTHRILELASRYQINLVVRYLPGRYNDTADGLSRFGRYRLVPLCRILVKGEP